MQDRPRTVEYKSRKEIERMKEAGRIAALALKVAGESLTVGMTTGDIDKIAENVIRRENAVPTFIGYRGYPATICASINDEVVHGIPGKRKIKDGDVVSIDVAATYDGFVGDTASTFIVGTASQDVKRLVDVTRESLQRAIGLVQVGNRLGDIGHAVQSYAEENGFGVVRDFIGHGIGRKMHEEPAVPNYGDAGTGLRIEAGLVIAIEPMVTLGDWKVKVLPDGWTVVTKDGSLAAHFEHTVACTEEGPLVLTVVS